MKAGNGILLGKRLNLYAKSIDMSADVTDKTEKNYTDEFKIELDNRYEEYMNGSTLVGEAEVDERIRKVIKGRE